jgi:hypothetical protein
MYCLEGCAVKKYSESKKYHTPKTAVSKVAHGDRETWRIASGGTTKTVTTTASSTSAMDEAVKIYGRALERLANR